MYRYQPHRRQSSAGIMAGAGRILSSRKGGVYAGAIRRHQSRKGGYGVSGAVNPWLEFLAEFRSDNAKEVNPLMGADIMAAASKEYKKQGLLKGPRKRTTEGPIKPKPKGYYWATLDPDGNTIPIQHIEKGDKPRVFRVDLPAGQIRRISKLGRVEIGDRRHPKPQIKVIRYKPKPSRRGSRAVAFDDEFQLPQEVNEDELQFSRG